MKFYNSIGPNPHMVRMFAAEKGISLDIQEVDLPGMENRGPEHLKRNPSGQMPALELDNGSYLSEVMAIAEYLDETHPDDKDLIGSTPEQRAQARMWARKVDLLICEPLAHGFRNGTGYDFFKDRMPCDKAMSEGLINMGQHYLKWLDGEMVGKEFLCGVRFTIGDVLLFAWLDFFASMGSGIDPDLKNLTGWYDRVKVRPSAEA